MKIFNFILALFCSVAFYSCNEEEIKFESFSKIEIGYNELDEPVQEAFKNVLGSRGYAEGKPYKLINLDTSNITMREINIVTNAPETKKRGGPCYLFKINNKLFSLNNWTGDPFVIYKSKLYMPLKHDAYFKNYMTIQYSQIDFSKAK